MRHKHEFIVECEHEQHINLSMKFEMGHHPIMAKILRVSYYWVFIMPLLFQIFWYIIAISTFYDISSTISGRIKRAEVLVEISYCLYFSKSKDRKIKLRVSKHIWSCEFLFFINTAIKIYCGCLLLGVMILFVSLTHFDIISIVGRSIESDRSQRFFQEFVYGIECEVPKSEEAWCNQMIDNKLYNFSLIYISAKRCIQDNL